jgi:hypothetical protein
VHFGVPKNVLISHSKKYICKYLHAYVELLRFRFASMPSPYNCISVSSSHVSSTSVGVSKVFKL